MTYWFSQNLSRAVRIALLAAYAPALPISAAAQYNVDWQKQQSEILDHYSSLIRIDSSSPPGNETRAAEYLKQVLDREGIPAAIYELETGRGNVVARLKGNGSKRPLLLMGHLDVVGVQKEKWTVDPFAAVRKDGYVYGRGSIDDKDKVTSALTVLLLLKRMRVPLDRDVIFLGEAGEEGNSNLGIGFMVGQHWSDIECEYAISEGGSMSSHNGKVRTVEIATTEKVGRGARLVAHGQSGHGSRPRLDNPLIHLSKAIVAVTSSQPPMRLNDTTRAYFESLAAVSTQEEAFRYTHVADPAYTNEIQAYFMDERTESGKLCFPDGDRIRCVACGHRCLIGEGKRGICKVRFNRAGDLRVPFGYIAALQCDPVPIECGGRRAEVEDDAVLFVHPAYEVPDFGPKHGFHWTRLGCHDAYLEPARTQ